MSSAIKISNARNITLDRFIAKNNYGRVVDIESCDVSILDSEFTGNVGDAVYINSTNTVISDSKFNSNTGRVLTINSVTTFITQCSITNNINPHSHSAYFEEGGIIHITPRSSFSKLSDSTASDCCVPTGSYSVVTHDTAIHIGSKEPTDSSVTPTNSSDSLTEPSCISSMKSSMADLECDHSEVSDSTQNPDAVNNTSYYCIDFSSMPASDLRNIR